MDIIIIGSNKISFTTVMHLILFYNRDRKAYSHVIIVIIFSHIFKYGCSLR